MFLRLACIGTIALQLFGGAGCGDSGDQPSFVVVPLSDLPCEGMSAGIWESHPFPPLDEACYWLEFRGQTTYEIEHPLGVVPSQVVGYIAFGREGTSSTIASGNSLIIQEAGDSTVTVKNAQNQLFYLRLALQ